MKRISLIACGLILGLSVGLAVKLLVLDGPGRSDDSDALTISSDEVATAVTGASAEVAATEVDPPVTARAQLKRSFRRLANSIDAPVGVSFGPIDGAQSDTLGSLRSTVAWSTSKVPVAVAALRESGSVDSNMRAAITESSNEAAEAMWASLGSPTAAGERVQRVLRDIGDESTVVQTRRVRPEFTAFGQTEWSIQEQQRFARWVACSTEAKPVYRLMGQVTPDQSWGIGSADSTAHFKGGWGPTENNDGYIVRQLGVITADDGRRVALAVATETPTSDQSAGAQILGKLARWVRRSATGSSTC